jgi:hypothetical protein
VLEITNGSSAVASFEFEMAKLEERNSPYKPVNDRY